MRYAQIRNLDISNGDGLGIALFVQGCHFHCKDCFNQETWDFNGGEKWTHETFQQFIELANKPHIKRISILGGEPLADENVNDVLALIISLKANYPEKKIWVYTGYLYEDIYTVAATSFHDRLRKEVLNYIDILCDGKFETDNADPLNKEKKWVGSTNQRVIDMHDTRIFHRLCNYNR